MLKVFDIIEEKYFSQLISSGFNICSIDVEEGSIFIQMEKENGCISIQLKPYLNPLSNNISLETEGVVYTSFQEIEPGHITHEDQKFFSTLKELVEKLSFPRAA